MSYTVACLRREIKEGRENEKFLEMCILDLFRGSHVKKEEYMERMNKKHYPVIEIATDN